MFQIVLTICTKEARDFNHVYFTRTIEVSEIEHKVDQARNFAELLDMLGDDVYDYEERGSKYSKADFGL